MRSCPDTDIDPLFVCFFWGGAGELARLVIE